MRRLVSLALVFALPLVACGDSGGGGRPAATGLDKTVLDAVELTRDAGSARVAGELDIESKGQKVTLAIDGDWSFAEKEGRRTLSGPVPTELIVKGGVLYTKNAAQTDPAKPWSRQPAGTTLGTTDPEQALNFLLGARDAKAAGQDDVRGEAADKYTVTIDIDDAIEALPDGESELLKRSTASLKEKEFPAEVWLDGEGRLRRLRYGIGGDGDKASPVISTIELFDFGVPVSVEPPPASEIAN